MSVRTEVAAALAVRLPDFAVRGYPRELDAVTRPTVLVWQERVEPAGSRWLATLRVWVLAPEDDVEAAEDTLDDALDAVVGALLDLPALVWEAAERQTLNDRHGYTIAAQISAKNKGA